MELLQLRYFLETAKNQSFTKTAEKFYVPVTSVSASIKRLENELGIKLFDRTANRITLNKNGEKLKKSVANAFYEIDSTVCELSENHYEQEIKLLVKAIRSDVTDYIIEYNKLYPKTIFKTVFDFSETDYGKYDVIIDEKNDLYKGYNHFELLSLQIKMKVCKDKFADKKFKLKDLEHENFITWGEKSNMHQALIQSCESVGFTPNIAVQLNDNECYEKLIKSGVGIGLGRDNPEKDYPDVVYLDVIDFDKQYVVNCYYNPLTYFGNVKNFIDFLKTKKNC